MFRKKKPIYGEELLAPRPTPTLEDHPLSAVRDCLINIFAAYPSIGGRSSIRNLTTRHAVVTRTHSSRDISLAKYVQNFIQHPAVKINSICRGNYWGSSLWISTLQVNY